MMSESEDFLLDALKRYHFDAEFHAEVQRAVLVVLGTHRFVDENKERLVRDISALAASVALNLRDNIYTEDPDTQSGRTAKLGAWLDHLDDIYGPPSEESLAESEAWLDGAS
jgi:hypothetical protein